MREDEKADLKLEINNLIWMHGDSETTLEKAEEKAITIMQLITNVDWFENWWAQNGANVRDEARNTSESCGKEKKIAEMAFKAALSL